MRFIILLALLMMAVSCRSHKEANLEATHISQFTVQTQNERDSISQIFDLLSAVSEIEMSGVSVEFFPPLVDLPSFSSNNDSILPDIRAAPRSISIDRVYFNSSSQMAKLGSSIIAGKETVNLNAEDSTEFKQESKSVVKARSPSGAFLSLSILLFIILIFVCAYIKFFKKN